MNILVERRGRVARLVINRPPLNILDLVTLRELRATLDAALNDSEVRMVEFFGAGEKAFSAGTDIRDHVPERAPEMLREFHSLIRAVLASHCPTAAVVRGNCLGGGMELALACDFILASSNARFALPEINVGAFPPVAAILLPRLIPEKMALEIILTGEPVTAEEAFRLGLVNRIAPDAALEDEVRKFSDTLLARSSGVLSLARKAARLGSRQAFEAAIRESERIYLEELLRAEDAREGVQAFLEKRSPRWKDWQSGGVLQKEQIQLHINSQIYQAEVEPNRLLWMFSVRNSD
jgi:cyclohexa-1,5-dienecarbonyl-CoA hydratase